MSVSKFCFLVVFILMMEVMFSASFGEDGIGNFICNSHVESNGTKTKFIATINQEMTLGLRINKLNSSDKLVIELLFSRIIKWNIDTIVSITDENGAKYSFVFKSVYVIENNGIGTYHLVCDNPLLDKLLLTATTITVSMKDSKERVFEATISVLDYNDKRPYLLDVDEDGIVITTKDDQQDYEKYKGAK